MKRIAVLVLGLLLILSCRATAQIRESAAPSPLAIETATATQPPVVPPEFEDLYRLLGQTLDEFGAQLGACEPSPDRPIFGAELLVASGNRGEKLLEPATFETVQLSLDRFEELGLRGVTVQISTPLLVPDYPHNEDYARFFKQVAREVHRRGMTLLVETGPVFPDPQLSNVRYDFSTFDLGSYFAARKGEIVRIAREVEPDYLAIGQEPSTEAMLTGLSISPPDYLAFVQGTLSSLDAYPNTRVGAGAGTWENPDYLRGFIEDTDLDFVDLHIYPIVGPRLDYLQVTLDTAALARAKGKRSVIGEAWLYKAFPSEIRTIHYGDIYARDAFSFWAPLDADFVRMVACLARSQDLDFISFFWSSFFFAYLDYDQTPTDLTHAEQMRALNQAVYANMLGGVFSPTGLAYAELLK